jgi:hypothetical protein
LACRNNPVRTAFYGGLSGRKMSERDDDRPAKVVPFGQAVPRAIADELRRYYNTLLDQGLPDKISALYQRFDELTKEQPEPEARIPKVPPATKEPPTE